LLYVSHIPFYWQILLSPLSCSRQETILDSSLKIHTKKSICQARKLESINEKHF
jgi:hypothetical protein